MALNQAQVNQLYNELLGRNATFGDASEYDADYWVGKTADQVKSGILGSSEYKNRAALVAGAGDAGISEAELDKQVLAGGWKTEHHSDFANRESGTDIYDFNRDNNWVSSTGGGNAWSKEQNAINQVLGATSGNNYSTGVGTGSGGGVTDGSVVPPVDTSPTDPDPTDPDPADPKTPEENSGMSMDKFMQFMMFMNMMRPQGGFGGGSQYGYGGLNPGGVQSAYNPMDNFNSYMDNFKSLSSGLLN